MSNIMVFTGKKLASYGFGDNHPFGPDRFHAFDQRYRELGLQDYVREAEPAIASQDVIERFHTHDYVELVKARSLSGHGFLDGGDTPAFAADIKALRQAVEVPVFEPLASQRFLVLNLLFKALLGLSSVLFLQLGQ